MIIMFVRHAESKNDKLTKFGKIQCKIAAKGKESIKFSKIYCSSANRCLSTARYFQKKYKLSLEVCESLKERELLANKQPQNEKEQEWFDNYMNPMYSCESPEGCKEYLARNFVEFKKIIDDHFDKNENVIIVAHSSTLYALYSYIHGISKGEDLVWARAGNCSKVYFEITSKV